MTEPADSDPATAGLRDVVDHVTVERVGTVSEGLDRVRSGIVDCVVAGYELPNRTGLEFLDAVRDENPNLPFVLVTDSGNERIASEAISAGVTDYLRRESIEDDIEPLADSITEAVTRYRSRRRQTNRHHLDRTLRVVNRELVRATSRDELEQTVCTALSDSEPYLSAWIGHYDPDHGRIVPEVWSNLEDDFFDGFTLSVKGEDRASGIVPEAIDSGEVQVVETLERVTTMETPDGFSDRGVQSAAAVPIVAGETIYGVLAVHANRPYAFDENEQQLLGDLGDTIAFAIDSLIRNRDLSLFRQLVDRSNDSIYVIDPRENRFVDVNQTACRRLGYEREALLNATPSEIVGSIGPQNADDAGPILEELGEGRTVVTGTHERADGTTFPVEAAMTYVTIHPF